MTRFSSLGKRLGASLTAALLFAVACAQVDRGYDPVASGGSAATGAEAGDIGEAGQASGGKAGHGGSGNGGMAGHAGTAGSQAGSMGDAGAAGSATVPTVGLTVTMDGNGVGSVVSDPPGIDCGTTCTAEFASETEVTLTATPGVGSIFAGWTGGGCSGTGTCVTQLTAADAITATFTLTMPTLTVTKAGSGTGTVTSDAAGINCGATCSAAYDYGTSVVLTPTPAAGSKFAGWTGACTGTAACTVPVRDATAVTATFDLIIPHITVTKTGTGLGTVTSAPTGIACGTTCSSPFTYGASVVLTAAAGVGSTFAGWTGGGCSGIGTCTISATQDTAVSAAFTCTPGTVTYSYTGSIPTFTVPACVTSLTIDAYGAAGGNAGLYVGGLGARMKATVAVSGGLAIKYLVGGAGLAATDTTENAGGTGGGGTFVVDSAGNPLVIAGGGGGASQYSSGTSYNPGNGLDASIDTAGLAPTSGHDTGGVNGLGGKTGSNANGYMVGTGGGGLLGDGVGNADGGTQYGSAITPGLAFIHGGFGGTPNTCGGATTCQPGRAGGFGGGGAAGLSGGGGGGYSGGGAGDAFFLNANCAAGGGGSFIAANATAVIKTAGARAGNGLIVFTY